jgi:hypothetical protein
MRRREFITLLGGAAAWLLATRAQQPDRLRRIGVLMGFAESDSEAQAYVAAFRDARRPRLLGIASCVGFLQHMGRHKGPDPITTRQGEKLLELRDDAEYY